MMHWIKQLAVALRILFVTDLSAVVLTLIVGLWSLLAAPFDRQGRTHQAIAAFCSRLFLRLSGVKVVIEGARRLPHNRSYVLVANHLSMLDIPVMLASLRLPFRFLAKRSLFRTPFVGWNLYFGKHVAVIREHRLLAARALHQAEQLLRQGISVLIFAEGTRSRRGLGRFKPGAAHLALKTRVPVVPLALLGTNECLPLGSIHVRPGTVNLRIGEAVETAGFRETDVHQFTELLRRRVEQLLRPSDTPLAGAEAVS